MFSGNANNSGNAGLVNSNSDNTPSITNTNIGSRLYFSKKILIVGQRPCLSAKNVKLRKEQVGKPKAPIKKNKMGTKRVSNLYEKIISLDNLRLADEKARKGKLKAYGVRRHDKKREENLLALHETLKSDSFKNSKYDTYIIHEPKEREIFRLPYFPDRIVHHAIMNVLEPIWVSTFTSDTFSCIKERGIHRAMCKVKAAMKDKEGTRYCLKIDIKKFYPSIDHEILKSIVRKKIKCERTLRLLDEIIDSAPGVPIGNYLSQYLANLYLAYFDHWVKEVKHVKYYFRYADDMVFLASTKEELHSLLIDIREYLSSLKLRLKGNEQVFPIKSSKWSKSGRGLDFVGFVFYHDQTLIRKSIKKNFCKGASRLNRVKGIKVEEYKQGICGWLGWAKYSDSRNLLRTIIKSEFYDKCLLRP